MAAIQLLNIYKTFEVKAAPRNREELRHFFFDEEESEMSFFNEGVGTAYRRFFISNLNLTIPDGKVLVILGPSGCGKTTLLRIIAGLIQPDRGVVLFNGINMTDVHPGERKIGMVFQDYALYPNFTARDNVLSYFIFRKRTPEIDELALEKYRKTSELLGVDIEYLMDKMPRNLSSGEKQRVALGRCITREPALFLLDEPFSNLDQKLRERYRIQLKRLLCHFNITTVYVTHDQHEAMILADELAIMNHGSIEQAGTIEEVYNLPDSIFIADFLNPFPDTPPINLLAGRDLSEKLKGIIIGVRSEDILICNKKESRISGIAADIRPDSLRKKSIITVKIGLNEVFFEIPIQSSVKVHDELHLIFKKYHIFDKRSGKRLETCYSNQIPRVDKSTP
ncbi:MAG: ABC transporter ATP-binding protein [Spirochaetota bacterium]